MMTRKGEGGSGKQIARHAFPDRGTRRQAGRSQKRREREPDGAEERHGNAPERSVPARIDLGAADGCAEVAEAQIRGIAQQVVVNVRRHSRRGEAGEREDEGEASGRLAHDCQSKL